MPAAEAEEGAAAPGKNSRLQRLLRKSAEEQGLLDSAQRHFDIVKTMTKRMKAELERMEAEGVTPTDVSMYTMEAVEQRIDLLSDPVVVRALEDLWQAANTSAEDEIIDKEEYLEMHRRVVLSLQPTVMPHEAVEAAEEDWERDSEGKSGLDRARFYICWFELADLWTDDIDRDEYVDFLEAQREIITERLPDGQVPSPYPQPSPSPSPSPSP